MNISAANSLHNLKELWIYNENALVIHTVSERVFKITALKNYYSQNYYRFIPFFEEEKVIDISNEKLIVWAKRPFDVAGGHTVEECLEQALVYLNEL